ncbi:hypothetical protein Pcinc_036256 [Petrolisthes cinctipes]|uniref:Large ribosomal subunit protein uL18m n=1 Tax=Petrolisthes cinctipes TaxID=88211 RepID=A0AAE1BW75_PETCI|nr:hypothetical protein Pcinc_036417 [Petrolisthes cinctipes]KAK3857495.1 hypothetical protein Pcinc_036256 [Petrolisthes cinctipes]
MSRFTLRSLFASAKLYRCPGCVMVSKQTYCSSYGENDKVIPNLVNRNPRNMEMLRLAHKPQGWQLEDSSRKYWYKLVMEHSRRHTIGRVVHHTGTTVVSASTQEWAIKQHLYSTSDVSAAHNIGRILADRCLKSGIAEVYTELDHYEETSEKVRTFLSAIRDGGVVMEEPEFIYERMVDMSIYKKAVVPWQVTEEEALIDSPSSDTPTPA